MSIVLSILAIVLILAVLWDGFETMMLPRRITRRFRFTRLFYRSTWRMWSCLLAAIPSAKGRETFRGFFGPLSLLMLLAAWAAGLVSGFSLLYIASEGGFGAHGGMGGFGAAIYMSATTFFTLGLGDVVPVGGIARALTAIEAAMGFGFLAVLISHLPALNQSFSKREVNISLLDARAGSPPTAYEMLRRHSHDLGMESLKQLLGDWERWSAELLESHLSYPVLAYYRSQHEDQSWLSALTAVLDVCALIMVGLEGACKYQAQLTFAMARHAVVDLAYVLKTPPQAPERDRLSRQGLLYLRTALSAGNLHLKSGEQADERLAELRGMYEPYIFSLSRHLHLELPPWIPDSDDSDNWQTSAWDRVRAARRGEGPLGIGRDHF